MKKIFNYILGISLFCFVLSAAVSCSKNSSELESVNPTPVKVENSRLVKFLSITLGVDSSEVILNKNQDSFSVRDRNYSVDEITKLYLSSNEYRAKYEN